MLNRRVQVRVFRNGIVPLSLRSQQNLLAFLVCRLFGMLRSESRQDFQRFRNRLDHH